MGLLGGFVVDVQDAACVLALYALELNRILLVA